MQLAIITKTSSTIMSSADSYGELELDSAILDKLAIIESTLISGLVDQSSLADPADSDDLFDPTFDDIVIQYLQKPDAAEDYKGRATPKPSKTSSYESPPSIPPIPTALPTAKHCGDDVFPGSSSRKSLPPESPTPEIPSSSGAQPQTPRYSIGCELDHSISAKSNCKRRAGKRKARVLDEGGEEVTGTHRRPGKRGRGRTALYRSRSQNRPHLLRYKATADMRGPEVDPDSDDPIDFLRSEP
jgi:hypothetical protein